MLDMRRMQLLRAVVTSGSVTAAARNLGYTPSAVSQQMATLEKEAGITLLERSGRGVRPTEAGRLLTEYAALIGRQVAEAETALADLRAGRTGRVVVRYFATMGATLLAPALAELRREQPGLQVDLRLTGSDDPLPEVREGRADAALVVRPKEPGEPQDRLSVDGVRFVHLLDDTYRAVLPKGHRLATKRVLELTDLAEEPWVGSEWPGPCLDAILTACGAAGFSPDFVVESEDYATAQGFVAAGLGVSLVPVTGLAGHHPAVVVRKVRNPEPVRAIYAAVRGPGPDPDPLRGLLDALRRAATP
ncbi:LysR family transcriptional regulator [Streptomyces scopuliridis]|uniref:LysR family transcriptional regulator n=1 Tax=Streptomyces scopuliridis TaxID=452529 RepID=UPI002DD804F6|nr:LysR family transcriptional regulator [Streptomyces scopuliridis]WSB34934.1 LysR family transcriptional regulator [Streptomyces scopuliridis]